jgi:Beige/BEACH domain
MNDAPTVSMACALARTPPAALTPTDRRAALESEHVSAWLHEWIDLTFGVALSAPAGLAAKNIHLCSLSTGTPAAPPAGNTTTGCSGGCPGGLGGDCSVPRWYSGVRQLFSAAHPARDPPSTRPTSQCTSQWWQPSAAAAAAAAVDAPRAAGPPPGEQELLLLDQQQQPRAAHLLRTAPTTTVPTTPL